MADRLAPGKLGFGDVGDYGVAAQFPNGAVKADPGPGGGFGEKEAHGPPTQVRSEVKSPEALGLKFFGSQEDVVVFIG
jgi:hypothetical protein